MEEVPILHPLRMDGWMDDHWISNLRMDGWMVIG
jgi:hypothetical protein